MYVRAKIVSVSVLAAVTAWVWPTLCSAQADNFGGVTYQMATAHGGSGALSSSGDEVRAYSASQQYQMGLTALQAGKLHEAERDFDHAVNADRKNPDYLTMRGLVRARQEDLSGAAQDFEKSLKLDPTQIAALREYGVVLARQGKSDKAKSQLAFLKLQAEACGETCPDAAKLKDATAAVQDALAQSGAHS